MNFYKMHFTHIFISLLTVPDTAEPKQLHEIPNRITEIRTCGYENFLSRPICRQDQRRKSLVSFWLRRVFTEVSHYRSEAFKSGRNITLIKAVFMSPAINFVIRWPLIYSMLVPTLLQSNICLVTVGSRQRCVMPVCQIGRPAWIIIKQWIE